MSNPTPRALSVGDVSVISGVTVWTLHHYDEIGLDVLAGRTGAGYRQYSEADCDRLSRILYYRELGFPLDAIATLLDAVEQDRYSHLERQHALLRKRLRRVQAMVASLERKMEAHMPGYTLTAEEKLEVFGDFDPAQYGDEACERWGDSDAWKQSRARAKRYVKDDWKQIKAEMADLDHWIAGAMRAGLPAASKEVMILAEEHRQVISRWFYDCSYEIHLGLADMYVADTRFTTNIDKAPPGLAAYLREAIIANADRNQP